MIIAPVALKSPVKGTLNTVLFTSLLLPTDPPVTHADSCPQVAWEAAEHLAQEKHVDVTKTLLRIIRKTYQCTTLVLFCFICISPYIFTSKITDHVCTYLTFKEKVSNIISSVNFMLDSIEFITLLT